VLFLHHHHHPHEQHLDLYVDFYHYYHLIWNGKIENHVHADDDDDEMMLESEIVSDDDDGMNQN
jgi:hypothetical protein